jgi:hypothetical protein
VWWRGVADIIILQGDTALTVDYKTGKSSKYAELKQLEIVSLAMFKHFPEVKKVKAGLMFLFADDFIKTAYLADSQEELWGSWISDVGQLEGFRRKRYVESQTQLYMSWLVSSHILRS